MNRLSAVGELPDELHRHPAPREAGERDRVESERQEFPGRGRVEDRHAVADERVVVLVRHGRALRLVVVAGEHHDRAVPAGAGEVPVLQGIAAPVDAGALPVPEPDDAVVAGMRIAIEHLGPGQRGRRQLLVRPRHVADVVLRQDRPRLAEGEVVASERGSRISADERPDPEGRSAVAPALVDRQAHKRLHAGEIDAPLLLEVAVIECQHQGAHVVIIHRGQTLTSGQFPPGPAG